IWILGVGLADDHEACQLTVTIDVLGVGEDHVCRDCRGRDRDIEGTLAPDDGGHRLGRPLLAAARPRQGLPALSCAVADSEPPAGFCVFEDQPVLGAHQPSSASFSRAASLVRPSAMTLPLLISVTDHFFVGPSHLAVY